MDSSPLTPAADWVVELDCDLRIISLTGHGGQGVPFLNELPVGLSLLDAIGAGQDAADLIRLHLEAGRALKAYKYGIDCTGPEPRSYNLSIVHAVGADGGAKGFHGTILLLPAIGRKALRRQTAHIITLDSHPHTFAIRDLMQRYVRVNRAMAMLVEAPASLVIGRRNTELMPPDLAGQITAEDNAVLKTERAFDFEQCILRADGLRFFRVTKFPIFDVYGQVVGIGETGIDVTQQKRLESELDRRANYDGLTELPNRVLARKLLDEAVLVAQHAGTRVGVLVADLSNFRTINDTLGHSAGDQILIEAAWRLRGCMSDANTIARLSGDEFCVIVPNLEGDAELDALATAIFGAFGAPFLIEDAEVFTGVNVGAAVYPDDADGPEQALRRADLAMSAVRRSGTDGYRRFTVAMGADIERRSRIGALLRGAFARKEFHLAYQPLVDAETGAVVAAEALLRWNSAELGVVNPDQFVPVAEENGMIIPIGAWTLEKACRDAAEWCAELGRPISVAVNVAPRQLLAPGFCGLVSAVLARTCLQPSLLKIEVTEGSLVADVDLCRQVLQDLRLLGVILALDDFGTGYSALSYLQQFEFDILKLDQSFIRKTQPGTPGAALAGSIIAMAACLGMKTVGEGVETSDHVAMLQSNGCNLMQGYLFSKPVSRRDLMTLITTKQIQTESHFNRAA